MTAPLPPSRPSHRGTLDDFLAPADIAPIPVLSDAEWNALRRSAGRILARRFCTLRNLWVHRGNFAADALGYAWGGIYRSLLVGSIVVTSYRNEGHLRAGQRMTGTGDFFFGYFALPRSSSAIGDIVAQVNLRHHVAGVVQPDADGSYRVIDGYEADYAYVATAFVESIRRGLAAGGLPPDSPAGRELGGKMCTVLYQLASYTGLRRIPRDLDAHERFRDAYDRHLREHPASPRVRRMAQEIARRILPFSAAKADEKVRDHVRRHLDAETTEYLFPSGRFPEELDQQREEWRQRIAGTKTIDGIVGRAQAREALRTRPDVASLSAAYRAATPDLTDDRLIGAILLHAIDTAGATRPFEQRTITLAAGEPFIRQGERVGRMYVLLSADMPLDVLRATPPGAAPRHVATILPPTVLGEIGMWRGRPAVATVVSPTANRLEVLVIDAEQFAALRREPGFRAATAAEVQRRLAVKLDLTTQLLDTVAADRSDPRLVSIAQLLRYLSGDSHAPLDAVIDLADDATPAECVDALRLQVDAAVRGSDLEPWLRQALEQVVSTIG